MPRIGVGLGLGLGQASSGAAPYVGLLDTYPSAAAAYSVRLLKSDYTGNAIRVRRSSDNAESDIGFSSGNLDTSALTSFCSGTNGFVTTWYDQSGNARDVIQTTAANQPQIVSSGSVINVNTKPSVKFDGTDDFLSKLSVTINQPITLFHIRKNNATNTQIQVSLNDVNSLYSDAIVGGNFRSYYGEYLISDAANTNQILFYSLANTTISAVSVNNNSETTGDIGTNNGNCISIGKSLFDGFSSNMNSQELIIYPSNQSSNKSGILSNINTYYAIY